MPRIMTASSQPPAKPAIVPSSIPPVRAISTDSTPTSSATREP